MTAGTLPPMHRLIRACGTQTKTTCGCCGEYELYELCVTPVVEAGEALEFFYVCGRCDVQVEHRQGGA